jgi:hypothetical protein
VLPRIALGRPGEQHNCFVLLDLAEMPFRVIDLANTPAVSH